MTNKVSKILNKWKYLDLSEYGYPNVKSIPVTAIGVSDDSMAEFNEVYQFLFNNLEMSKIIRTTAGYISKETIFPAYDVRTTTSHAELTLVIDCKAYRVQFRKMPTLNSQDTKVMSGTKAFKIFRETCKEYNIDIDSYKISNGKEIKKEIEKPLICYQDCESDVIYTKAHHIDFHSSYPAGLVNTHPEFKEIINYLYTTRKTNPINKLVLDATIGYMQSDKCHNALWAHLSRDAIADNNRRIRELAKNLEYNNCIILAYNTDGIWFIGDQYHDENEGPNLGQWAYDHINCKIRFKSPGSYEFIENGKYTPVVRGRTTLDKEKDRTEWEWGDIYKGDIIEYYFEEGKGIQRVIKE